MTKTNALVVLALSSVIISSIASSDDHAVSTLADLEEGAAERDVCLATLEPNGWLLDGKARSFTHPHHVGFVSSDISDLDTDFTTPPVITLTLDASVDIQRGITLEFNSLWQEHPDSVNIEFRNAADALIDEETYTIDSPKIFMASPTQPVEDVKYIVIEFLSMNTAYRHVHLQAVYVDALVFNYSDIQSAPIIEEIDPVSIRAPFNKLDLTINSPIAEFSVLNENSFTNYLVENQTMDVYVFVDEVQSFMGRFYLKEWHTEDARTLHLEGICGIGLLDEIDFVGGAWIDVATAYYASDHIDAGDLLDLIMVDSIAGYTLDSRIASQEMNGVLFRKKVRLSLQEFCFALSAHVTCARSKTINIVLSDVSISSYDFLSHSQIAIQSMDMRPIVHNVQLDYWLRANIATYHEDISENQIPKNIYTQSLVAGDHIIYMDKIQQEYEVLGTAVLTSPDITGVYYAFTCTTPGTFTLCSYGYYGLVRKAYLVNANTDGIFHIPSPLLLMDVSPYANVGDFIYAYYEQRYVYKFKTFGRTDVVGDRLAALTEDNTKYVFGMVEKVETDPAMGLVSTITLVGNLMDLPEIAAGKYDDRYFSSFFSYTPSFTTYVVGYLNTQIEIGDDPFNYLHVSVSGSSFDIGYISWNDCAELHIQIDGGEVIDVDTNEGSSTKVAEIWESGDLGSGTHLVKIWAGGGGGEYILFDYIEVYE